MKYLIIILIIFLSACRTPTRYTIKVWYIDGQTEVITAVGDQDGFYFKNGCLYYAYGSSAVACHAKRYEILKSEKMARHD